MFGFPSWGVGPNGPNPESVKERLNEETLEEGHNPPSCHLINSLPP